MRHSVTIVSDAVNYSFERFSDTLEMGRPEDCVDYVDRLNWALERAAMDPATLAKRLKVTRNSISKLVNRRGSRNLNAKNSAAAAIVLEVSSDWLAMGGKIPWQRDYPWSVEATEIAYLYDQVRDESARRQAKLVMQTFLVPPADNGRIPVAFRNPDTSSIVPPVEPAVAKKPHG